MDLFLKEAASSAQVYLDDERGTLSGSSVELQTSYPQNYVERFVPLNLFQDSCSLELSTLPSHHKKIIENLLSKVSYQVNYFALESETESNEAKLICKICCKILHIAKVEEHILDQVHLRKLVERCNSKIPAIAATSKGNWKCKTSGKLESLKGTDKNLSNVNQRHFKNTKTNLVPPSSAELNKKYNATIGFINDRSKKVVRDLTEKLKDYMSYFEPHEIKGNKSSFSCKMCRISFPTKNAKLHIYSNLHLRNLRRSLSVAKLETSDARNKKIVKDLVNQFNNRLYFFQLINDDELDELYFVCKVCTLVLDPECLKSHIYSTDHSKNLQVNPVVLNYDSLNDHNKQIVKGVKNLIQVHGIKDFTFVYRIGTEELRFFCKCCHLTLIPEKVADHVKTSEHLVAVKSESNSKKQVSEDDVIINACLRSETSIDRTQVTPLSETEHQNLTIVGFDSLNLNNRATVELLETELDSELIYFDLLQSAGTNELYFKCTLCDVILKPAFVVDHVMSPDHMKNWELNVHFEDFLSLEDLSRKTLRTLFFEVGSKLNAFYLAPNVDNAGLQFTCKFCHITLCSDMVLSHLQTKNHKKRTGEKNGENFIATSSREFLEQHCSKNYLDGEPITFPAEVNTDPASVRISSASVLSSGIHSVSPSLGGIYSYSASSSSEIHSALTSSDLHGLEPDLNLESIRDHVEEVPRLPRKKSSALNLPIESNKTPFVCQDCGLTVHFKPVDENGLFKKTAEGFFISCVGNNPFGAILSGGKNCQASKKNTSDCETSPSTLMDSNAHSNNSNRRYLSHNPTASQESSLESKGVLSDTDKETLKDIIDKIGIKVNNFDFVLTSSSSELRVKCKFCSLMMRPETVEDHLKCDSHVKYSQLSNVSSLQFESLNDRNKKIVRKLLNNIGCEINDFDVTVTLGFVCKICNANVNAETIPDHIKSEEHLQQLQRRDSQFLTSNSDKGCNNYSHLIIGKMTDRTTSNTSSYSLSPTDFCQNVTDLNLRSSSSAHDGIITYQELENVIPKPGISGRGKPLRGEEKPIERVASEKMIKSAVFTDLVQTAASRNGQVDSNDFNLVLSPEVAAKSGGSEIQQNLLVSPENRFTQTAAINSQCQDLRNPLEINDLQSLTRVQNSVHSVAEYPEINRMVQNPSLPLQGNSRIEVVQSITFEKTSKNADGIYFANRNSCGKFQVDSQVSGTVLHLESAEKRFVEKKVLEVSPAISNSGDVFAPTVVFSPVHPMGLNDPTLTVKAQKNVISADARDPLAFSEFKSSIQNPNVSGCEERLSSDFKNESRQCSSGTDECFTCAACSVTLPQAHIEDLANHVNSEDHNIKLNLSPVESPFTNLSNYSQKIVEMFLGDIRHLQNNFDIVYEMPQKELCFYCKLCHTLLHAEALEKHVNHVHLRNFTEKYDERHPSNNLIDDAFDCRNFNFEALNQNSKLFLCQVCNYKVHFKGVTNHLQSEKHLSLSKIRGDSLRFKNFSAYKEKVITMLCCEFYIRASDFEFFLKMGSPKLYLYCKPCKVLLWPESLPNHLKTTSFHSKGTQVSTSESSENKCSLM